MLSRLLGNIEMADSTGVEETRVRSSNLLCKVNQLCWNMLHVRIELLWTHTHITHITGVPPTSPCSLSTNKLCWSLDSHTGLHGQVSSSWELWPSGTFVSHAHLAIITCHVSMESILLWNPLLCVYMFLSLGRSYEAGTCTIVISVKGAFNWYLFCYRLDFNPKSGKKRGL